MTNTHNQQMKADVYRCLKPHEKTWSVRSRETHNYGIVQAHAPALIVKDGDAVVQEAGRQRCLDEGQKNVHAFIRGRVLYTTDWLPEQMYPSRVTRMKVHYRPEWGQFRDVRGFRKVEEAARFNFYPDGTCIAINPICTIAR